LESVKLSTLDILKRLNLF